MLLKFRTRRGMCAAGCAFWLFLAAAVCILTAAALYLSTKNVSWLAERVHMAVATTRPRQCASFALYFNATGDMGAEDCAAALSATSVEVSYFSDDAIVSPALIPLCQGNALEVQLPSKSLAEVSVFGYSQAVAAFAVLRLAVLDADGARSVKITNRQRAFWLADLCGAEGRLRVVDALVVAFCLSLPAALLFAGSSCAMERAGGPRHCATPGPTWEFSPTGSKIDGAFRGGVDNFAGVLGDTDGRAASGGRDTLTRTWSGAKGRVETE